MRPSSGVVAPGRRLTVALRLAPGVSAQQAASERFLLVAAPVPSQQLSAAEVDNVWRVSRVRGRVGRVGVVLCTRDFKETVYVYEPNASSKTESFMS